jgi:hypothetical protein
MPARADINPGDIPHLLRHVIMMRVLRNPLDFEYVLVGNACVEALGFNLSRMKVSDLDKISPGYSQLLHAFNKIICDMRAPLGGAGRLVHVQRDYRQFEGIYMPLSDDGETVDRIFAVAEYTIDTKLIRPLN